MNVKEYWALMKLLFKDRAALISFLLPIFIELGKEFSEELLVAANDIVEELFSEDGLTRKEAYAIARERLVALRAEEIGNKLSDEAFDFLLTMVIKRIDAVIPAN
jgi:hypothetical protein